MKVELVSKTVGVGRYDGMSAGQIIEAVARHGKIKNYGKLIQYLVKNAHWSPLEHVHYSFRVETSRAISAQIFRHRSLHFQELSQRYDTIQEIEPIEWRAQGKTSRQVGEGKIELPPLYSSYDAAWMDGEYVIKEHLNRTQHIYNKLVESGVAKECARMILPMTSKTVIHITGNVRDLFAFLNVRCDAHAQKEVRDIALAMGEILEKEMPEVMGNMAWREGMFM